jgi:hypothetical protein
MCKNFASGGDTASAKEKDFSLARCARGRRERRGDKAGDKSQEHELLELGTESCIFFSAFSAASARDNCFFDSLQSAMFIPGVKPI